MEVSIVVVVYRLEYGNGPSFNGLDSYNEKSRRLS